MARGKGSKGDGWGRLVEKSPPVLGDKKVTKKGNAYKDVIPLLDALRKAGAVRGEDFWDMVAKRCWTDNKVLCEILKKVLPDKVKFEGETGVTNYIVAIKVDGKEIELPTSRKAAGGI